MNSLVKFLWNIGTSLWCVWSNYRFKDTRRFDTDLQECDKVSDINDIKELVSRLYCSFIWTQDGIDQLGDAITPPPENYNKYLNAPLKDDCDGFHSLVYHCLKNSGIECYLMTANPLKGGGHCILIFKYDDKWYVNDYNKVYMGHKSIVDSVNDYNKEYPIRYKTSEVIYNGFVSYDYVEGKFKRVDLI